MHVLAQDSAVLPARFLRASFRPPEQQLSLLARPRLFSRLDEASQSRLLLLIAPAGCGKSTLLSQWSRSLAERRASCAWLNVIRDAGPTDLFLSIAWAFELGGVSLQSTGILSEFSDGSADCQERLAFLLAAVAQADESVVLVLDEFERLRDPESLALVALLITACPPNLHFVIACRRRPELPVSTLHAQGLVTTVSAEELIFSTDETRALLAEELTPEEAEVVIRRTEGWPVAVTLAKLWLRQSHRQPSALAEFSGSVAEVSAYLAEQVVAGLEEELRDFLLDVSVLEQVSPAIADSLRGRCDSTRFVHGLLELRPAVVVLDRVGPIVRLHPLLIEHLAGALRARDPQRLSHLHEAAAGAYARSGRLLESIQHAMAASNPELACRLLLEQAPMRVCVFHGSAEVSACLRLLPQVEWSRHPRLRLCDAFLMIRRGDHLRADLAFSEIKATANDPSASYLAESFVIEVMIAFRCPHRSEQKLEELEERYRGLGVADTWARFSVETLALVVNLRAGRPDAARRNIDFQRAVFADVEASGSGLHIDLHTAHWHLAKGDLTAAETMLKKVFRVARSVVGPEKSVTAIARSFLYCIHYETDREELTETEIRNLLDDLEKTDAWFDHYVAAYSVAIELAYRSAGVPGASKIISRGRIVGSRQMLGPAFERLLSTLEADLLTREGVIDGAARWLAEGADVRAAECTYYERDASTRAQARLLLARGLHREALDLANAWAVRCAQEGRKSALCRARLIGAIASLELGLLPESRASLAEAVVWAAAESAMAPFLELRGETQRLLDAVDLTHVILPAETRQFLDAVRDRIGQTAYARRLYSLLTRRESEILGLLRHNPSNKHVARVARISEDAVKFHLKNIYRKLGVHTRDEALRALDNISLSSQPGASSSLS